MWRHYLETQSCNEELLKEIREAVERCREELQHAPAEDHVEAPEQAPEDPEFVADLPAKRPRRPVDRYNPTMLLILHVASHECSVDDV